MEKRDIKVVLRIRPPNDLDTKQAHPYRSSSGPPICLNLKPDGQQLSLVRDAFNSRDFCFDHVFGPSASTAIVYQHSCKEVVADYLKGYNASIICYGQTGTGKSHTMFGRTDKWNEALPGESRRFEGVVQASLIAIFDHINSCHKRGERAELFISFYEIYLERVRDLLVQSPSHRGCPSGPSLTVRENADKGAFVEGLSTFSVRDMDAVYDLIHRSVANRVTHELAMNRSSSRSHAILQVTLEQDCREGRDDGMTDEEAERVKESKGKRTRAVFTFVDLAGSERVTKTGSTGARLREAKTINKSICALGNCIQALAAAGKSKSGSRSKQYPHIPFRDSKLTRLLAEAIGGNAKTCIIATVGPCAHSYEETLSTLIFASRAATIKKMVRQVKPVRGVFSDLSASIQEWRWPPPAPPQVPGPSFDEKDAENSEDSFRDDADSPELSGDEAEGSSDSVSWGAGRDEPTIDRPVVKLLQERREDYNERELRKRRTRPGQAQICVSLSAAPLALPVADYTYNISQEEVDPNVVSMTSSRLHTVQNALLTKPYAGSNGKGCADELDERHHRPISLHSSDVQAPLADDGANKFFEKCVITHRRPSLDTMSEWGAALPASFDAPNSSRSSASMEIDSYSLTVHELAQLSNEALTDRDFGRVVAAQQGTKACNSGCRGSAESKAMNEMERESNDSKTWSEDDFVTAMEKEIEAMQKSANSPTRVVRSPIVHKEHQQSRKLASGDHHVGTKTSGNNGMGPGSTRVTIFRDTIHLSSVPPPPTVSGTSGRPITMPVGKNHLSRNLLASVRCVDHCTSTDICAVEYVDKGTNTPLAALSDHRPCLNCRGAEAEILYLRNEGIYFKWVKGKCSRLYEL